MMRSLNRIIGTCVVCSSAIGCTANLDPAADPVTESTTDTQESALYGGGSLGKLWDTTSIPVCFRVAAGNDARKQLTREFLEDTWSRVTPLRFTGFGTCTSTNPSALPG